MQRNAFIVFAAHISNICFSLSIDKSRHAANASGANTNESFAYLLTVQIVVAKENHRKRKPDEFRLDNSNNDELSLLTFFSSYSMAILSRASVAHESSSSRHSLNTASTSTSPPSPPPPPSSSSSSSSSWYSYCFHLLRSSTQIHQLVGEVHALFHESQVLVLWHIIATVYRPNTYTRNTAVISRILDHFTVSFIYKRFCYSAVMKDHSTLNSTLIIKKLTNATIKQLRQNEIKCVKQLRVN